MSSPATSATPTDTPGTTNRRLRWIEPAAAARAILRGVERNRAIITVTPLASRVWWLYRLLPGFAASWLGDFSMRRLRREFSSHPERIGGSNG